MRDATPSDRTSNRGHAAQESDLWAPVQRPRSAAVRDARQRRGGLDAQKKAQGQLEDELAKVRLGVWKAPEPEPTPTVENDPTFHVFSSEWFDANEQSWRPKIRRDYEWKLSDHLLPFFKSHRLSQITISEVDPYRTAKVKQRKLSAASINKTITLLAQILEVAVEYGQIERNPARGRRRRLKADKPAPVWLDSAVQIRALLDAAGELDRDARFDRQVPWRAILATLTFAGLRIGELVELRWRDVDLAGGKITIRSANTHAGARMIDLLPALRDELATLKADAKPHSRDRVFPTQSGGPLNQSNVRNRLLAKAVERANEHLEDDGHPPLPDGLTPHKLRHTFASLLVALGTDPGAVMDQLGHEDAALTLRVYRHGMRRDEALEAGARAARGQRKGSEKAAVAK